MTKYTSSVKIDMTDLLLVVQWFVIFALTIHLAGLL